MSLQRVTSCLIHLALALAGFWGAYGFRLWSEEPTPAPPTTFVAKLASLTSRAALIFMGQVIATERRGDVVAITFRVDETVAGEAGGTYVLREWAGLWPQGLFRYAVGDRALVFLRGASAAGFATPVDGAEGFIPVSVQGADAPAVLDTRRLASSLQRFPGTPLATPSGGTMLLSSAVAVVKAEIDQETAGGHRRLKAPLRVPVGHGIVGQTGGLPGTGGDRLAIDPIPGPRAGSRVIALRRITTGVADETR